MKLVFEIKETSNGLNYLPELDVPAASLPKKLQRKSELHMPCVSENGVSRHYSALSRRIFGHNNGFYPLGSCTMKYNPKINDQLSALDGFAKVHPLQDEDSVQGSLEVLYHTEKYLAEITGMDAVTLQPAAGAHGEFCGLLLIKAYHLARKDTARKKIIVPDSAHGTNPASAVMAGFEVISIPSNPDGSVDISALKNAVGPDTAGLMLTNPNTVGMFDKNILQITEIVHKAGGLCYYDGANLNAVMGVVRPGDMGFDVVHLNLHKTFSTPHGGGGPGSGPVGCKSMLVPYLPYGRATFDGKKYHFIKEGKNAIGAMKAFWGNYAVVVRALAYIMTLGAKGIRESAENAVLNANYLKALLEDTYFMPFKGFCMHEFVTSLEDLKKQTGISAMDIAKSMLDRGYHPPTMYFPLIVHECLMFEPTETENKETLDECAKVLCEIYQEAFTNPEKLHTAPHNAVIGRPDEVGAARKPIIKYAF